VTGAGCAPVPGDPTQAWCIVTVAKRFTVSAAGGDDTVTNHTGLQMTADGGIGNDSLYARGSADVDTIIGNLLPGIEPSVSQTLRSPALSSLRALGGARLPHPRDEHVRVRDGQHGDEGQAHGLVP
jgi:hypothetical protein